MLRLLVLFLLLVLITIVACSGKQDTVRLPHSNVIGNPVLVFNS